MRERLETIAFCGVLNGRSIPAKDRGELGYASLIYEEKTKSAMEKKEGFGSKSESAPQAKIWPISRRDYIK